MDRRPEIVNRSKSSSHPLKHGRFYTGTVTAVLVGGRINIKIPELGTQYGPLTPLNTTSTSRYIVGDSVKCGFADEFFNEVIVFGSTRIKEDVFAVSENGIDRFADYSARDYSIPVPSEGRVVYVLNTDELQIYNGSTWITVIDTGSSENISVESITATSASIGTLTVTGPSTLTVLGSSLLSASTSIGTVSNTEIGYLDGVTSGIQTQIDTKAPSASPTFTGIPTAPTASAGTNTTQLATTAFVGAAVSVGMPTGAVIPYAGSAAPTGWLLCDGGSSGISRTTYAALFAVIGTTYGSGDGSTTFNVPDLRGRVPAGKDNMGGIAANLLSASVSGVAGATLGAKGGSQSLTSHNHTQNSHNHTQNPHNHTQNPHGHTVDNHVHNNTLSNNTVASSGHTHPGQGTLAAAVGATNDSTNRIGHIAGNPISGPSTYSFQGTNVTLNAGFNHNSPVYGSTGGNSEDRTVTISNAYTQPSAQAATATNIENTATNVAATATNNATGAGASENVQPTIILNYIIKA
jgi:microcystin-dependent protein